MRYRTFSALLALGFAGVGLAPQPGAAQYPAGFIWCQGEDYLDEGVEGTSIGNPEADGMGNPTWSYLIFPGTGTLDSANPWFTETPALAVWDSDFLGFGDVWVRADNTSPLVGHEFMQQDTTSSPSFDFAPGVRWTNPTGQDVHLQTSGAVRVFWRNYAGGPLPTYSVDVVLFIDHVATGSRTFLVALDLASPAPSADLVTVTIPPTQFLVGPGDRITLTVRARAQAPTSQIQVGYDLPFTHRGALHQRGDVNGDDVLDVSDPITLLGALFLSQSVTCEATLDANDDDVIDLSDAVYLLGSIFGQGPLPPHPSGSCGLDPTPLGLTCALPPTCP